MTRLYLAHGPGWLQHVLMGMRPDTSLYDAKRQTPTEGLLLARLQVPAYHVPCKLRIHLART